MKPSTRDALQACWPTCTPLQSSQLDARVHKGWTRQLLDADVLLMDQPIFLQIKITLVHSSHALLDTLLSYRAPPFQCWTLLHVLDVTSTGPFYNYSRDSASKWAESFQAAECTAMCACFSASASNVQISSWMLDKCGTWRLLDLCFCVHLHFFGPAATTCWTLCWTPLQFRLGPCALLENEAQRADSLFSLISCSNPICWTNS
ncbi:hypothetical protein LR48_Vigan02g084900 [Vigna angularis]|uniref:Uncharacterized protein n=1 Tax=Phaseolus angularis TaxID=3914 RepID=A0A0L9TWZ2_PHAAN|nr:hypothetical protein LR48_Vigan02g084900 [Vigna angularis]